MYMYVDEKDCIHIASYESEIPHGVIIIHFTFCNFEMYAKSQFIVTHLFG